MDKKLNELAKKIADRQIEVPTATYTSCIDKFYDEIISILHDDRTIKSLFLALNENGFNIKYQWLSKALKNLEKTNIDIKKPDIIFDEKEQDILVPSKNSQSIEPPKEIPLSSDEIAKRYFAPKPLPMFMNKNTQPEQEQEPKKHLSMKEKAALSIADLGIDFDENPILKNRLQKLKDKNS